MSISRIMIAGWLVMLTAVCVFAKDYEFSGYTETGKRSSAEDFEEEDADDDYTYHNYHLKFKHDISELLSYNIGSFIYDKDYKYSDSLDNTSKIFKTVWIYYMEQKNGDPVRLNIGFNYKTKRYTNAPNLEFDQITAAPSFTFMKKDKYTVDFKFGFSQFDYPEATNKDLYKSFAGLDGKRYFFNKKLLAVSSARFEQADQSEAGRKKNKLEFTEGFDCKFALPWLYKIKTRFKWGDRDTKDDIERSVDYDYGYFRYNIRTDHKIGSKVKANLKFQFFKKDYITAAYDHKGYYVSNGWDYDFFNDKEKRIWFNMDAEHKDVRYEDRIVSDYKKESAGLTASYQKKKNWKVSAGTKGIIYDYRTPDNDKKRYYAALAGEKMFMQGRLTTTLDLKYRHTNSELRNDTDYETVRVAFRYRF
ncbi:MAG: hypothetical protein JW983_04775 [Elusimicrobia bacterium]|nr:hypothetical protein [Elusimicrobiota bacterium]